VYPALAVRARRSSKPALERTAERFLRLIPALQRYIDDAPVGLHQLVGGGSQLALAYVLGYRKPQHRLENPVKMPG